MEATWEGIATDVLDATSTSAPVDAFVLAKRCRLEVRGGVRSSRREGNVIHIDASTRRSRQHGTIAHELGHFALERAGEPDTEPGARYLAGALMLPRRDFDRDLRQVGWQLGELQGRNPNASLEMIARRIVQMRDAVMTIVDHGKVRYRRASPWLEDPRLGRITKWERQLVDDALRAGEPVRGSALVWAVPVIDPPWERVVIIAELEQLALRYE